MPDREKVIRGLEAHATGSGCMKNCPYWGIETLNCSRELATDALALLKAQEPVSVQKKPMEMVGLQTWDWACGNCGQTVLFSAKFCPWCGRAVKWE